MIMTLQRSGGFLKQFGLEKEIVRTLRRTTRRAGGLSFVSTMKSRTAIALVFLRFADANRGDAAQLGWDTDQFPD